MTTALRLLTAVVALSACASAPSGEPALVFGAETMPECEFEITEQISAQASVRGDRRVAEEALHRALARVAERQDAHGVIRVEITAPDRVPMVVARSGQPPADLPAVTWRATAQAIRFTDPTCRK